MIAGEPGDVVLIHDWIYDGDRSEVAKGTYGIITERDEDGAKFSLLTGRISDSGMVCEGPGDWQYLDQQDTYEIVHPNRVPEHVLAALAALTLTGKVPS